MDFMGKILPLVIRWKYGAPRAILSLNVTYKDGSTETVCSDDTWKASGGPVLFDNIYHGET
jgi:alpha-L-rhamnosidase